MATKLRLQRDYQASGSPNPAGHPHTTPDGTLRFPSQAVASLARHKLAASQAKAKQRPAAFSHEQLVSHIEATLDRMQGQLSDLRDQVDNFKFPGVLDNDRPRAA